MSRFTVYGWSLAAWSLLNSFQVSLHPNVPCLLLAQNPHKQYGFHISALNQLQAVLTCKVADVEDPVTTPAYGLPTCIPMSDATFSVVTAVFTIGGLLGSMGANVLIERRGRRSAVRAAALLNLLGAGLMTAASTVSALIGGR
jgi:MFS transporter, SP family, solute carrier family 2 (facilitated glucose transporter), member 3